MNLVGPWHISNGVKGGMVCGYESMDVCWHGVNICGA